MRMENPTVRHNQVNGASSSLLFLSLTSLMSGDTRIYKTMFEGVSTLIYGKPWGLK